MQSIKTEIPRKTTLRYTANTDVVLDSDFSLTYVHDLTSLTNQTPSKCNVALETYNAPFFLPLRLDHMNVDNLYAIFIYDDRLWFPIN